MLLKKIFDPFVKERPICVMARAVLERLLNAERINALFQRVAERQYTRELLFSQLAELMSEVTLGLQPAVHAAYQTRKDELGVSATALYNKLDRVETAVSAELVRDSFREAEPVIKALGSSHPCWLPGYRTLVLDGNALAATEHRIDDLRTTWAAPLPGRALVVLNQQRMLVQDVFLTEDGHAQERSLLSLVLKVMEPGDLWIADRNFCTLGFLFGIVNRGAFFLIRQHGNVVGRLIGRRKYCGKTKTGKVYEQRLALTDPETGEERTFRRITVELYEATRDGDMVLHLLTNLPEEDASAIQVAELYRERWTIETAFFEITTTLACEVNTLGYPKASLFAFCLALLAYNAVAVIKAALRRVHGAQTVNDEVSAYYLSLEIERAYDGMMVSIPAVHWQVFRDMSPKEFAVFLRTVAEHVNLARYQKHPRGPKKKPVRRTAYRNGSHVSTARILAERKKRKTKPKKKPC